MAFTRSGSGESQLFVEALHCWANRCDGSDFDERAEFEQRATFRDLHGVVEVVELEEEVSAHGFLRLHEGAIGDVLSMRVYWNGGPVGPKAKRADLEKSMGRPPTEMEYQIRNWYMFNWLCGDHIVEQHIHNIDVINWAIGGHPESAVAMGGRQVRTEAAYGHVFDHFSTELEYEGGVLVQSSCRQIDGCENRVGERLVGTKGTSDPSRSGATHISDSRSRLRSSLTHQR